MNIVRLLCFNIIMFPFYVIGVLMHLSLLGYALVEPLMIKMLLPEGLRDAGPFIMAVSREEVETFINDYMKKNPNALPEDALKAFVKSKKEQSNA